MKKLAALFLLALCAHALAETYTSPELGFTFPAQLAGLELVYVTDFEKQTKGLGVGLSYRNPAARADIYIYNYGLRRIAEGIASPEIKEHLNEVKGEVIALERRGDYQDVAFLVISEPVTIGGVTFLHSEMSFQEGGVPRASHIYLTALKNQFLKIRFTVDTTKEDAEKLLKKFLDELAPVFSKS